MGKVTKKKPQPTVDDVWAKLCAIEVQLRSMEHTIDPTLDETRKNQVEIEELTDRLGSLGTLVDDLEHSIKEHHRIANAHYIRTIATHDLVEDYIRLPLWKRVLGMKR